MIRRFLGARLGRESSNGSASRSESEDGSSSFGLASPKVPPPAVAFVAEEKQRKVDTDTSKVEELAPFDTCIEACDELASTSTSSGRVDPTTGLADCSVLVSADGELLIIPQEQQAKISEDGRGKKQRSRSAIRKTASQLGMEYESALFVGSDLNTAGDKVLNGFSARGWSIPAASLAMKQSSDVMADLADFVEDLVLAKKSCAAQESQMVDKLGPLVVEDGGPRVDQYQEFLKETYPDQNLEVLPTRVGPLSSPGGTVQATLVGLEDYFSTMAESDSARWRLLAENSGPLPQLRTAKTMTDQRALNRQFALQEMLQRTKTMESHLTTCKEDAARKWDDVHAAEEKCTELVEEKMLERSRQREQQRLEQLKQDEAKRSKDATGNLGATQTEIWDIVSAVAASMEEGSFEPMDLPQAPLAAPRDKSRKSELVYSEAGKPEEDVQNTVPITSRAELEQECGLPEFRVAALAADEAVSDAANSLLNVLSNWDTTSRSARLAAETCLVSACNAQASCLRAIISSERESIRERAKMLDDLEEVADSIDVRADMNHYITLDKKDPGGCSFLGDDDDGGIASALAVLNNHIDGNMGLGTPRSFRQSVNNGAAEEELITVEHLEEGVDKFFKDAPLLRADAPDDDPKTTNAHEAFEINILRLCKIGKDKSSSGRSRRSTICYTLNSKRSVKTEIPSAIQFEGLCRVFYAVLAGCGTEGSGVTLAKMLMTLSQSFYMQEETEGGTTKEVYVKNSLVDHPLWENEEFWDQALYQTVAESLTHSGVMANFERPSARTASQKKKSEWTETYKMKWHDLKDQERCEAASQVHAVVFAQLGALAHSMIEFGCGLQRSCAFVRRMSVRNQLPMSQRAMLLQHLMLRETDDGSEKPPVKLTTPSR